MPDKPAGSNSDNPRDSVPNSRGRKPAQPSISDDALAALERHYGGAQNDAGRNDSDSASATGFAAMLAQGGIGGGSGAGSSGALPAMGGAHDSLRRDTGEIPEAKIIAVRPDSPAPPDAVNTDEPIHTDSVSADASEAEPTIYTSVPVEEVDDPALRDIPTNASRPPVVNRVPFKRPTGMPEHYKTLIPILAAMGLVALAIGIWAVMHLTSGQAGTGSSVAKGQSSLYQLFSQIAVLGLPLGLLMLGLTGFIFKRYWNKG